MVSCLVAVTPIPGAGPEPEYHNYLLDGLSGTLEQVRGALKPPQGIIGDQIQQLSTAAENLRGFAEQIIDVRGT